MSYFKGLNAGLESTAKFFGLLGASFEKGNFIKESIGIISHEYSNWFLHDFAPKKVKEVEKYSFWRIRTGMRFMEALHTIKESSLVEYPTTAEGKILEDYFKYLGSNNSLPLSNKLYPHRSYDPIELGQLRYVPITHTLVKIIKLFVDYFKPYKDVFHFKQDLKQPSVGLVNLFTGVLKGIAGIFTLTPKIFADGLLTTVRGAIEIATTPLAWFVKPITRGSITLIRFLITGGSKKIEENTGINKVAEIGLKLIKSPAADTEEHKNNASSQEKRYTLAAIIDDLHRKFDKASNRGQASNISTLTEEEFFIAARRNIDDNESLIKYFLLFAPAKSTASEHIRRKPSAEASGFKKK